ncbi:hypothetical protein [Paenibacillus sinopodophylli]|uniref:hypothetical protein n=1 Tax=Paenibacillus sinopodophylli TaxID=1837342 RepID=UPI00110CE7AE|nr:hypothetical protein [Paenibacillus sinopodophylli]
MMIKTKAMVIILAVFLLSGCNVMNEKYDATTSASVSASEDVSAEDKAIFSQAVEYAETNKVDIEGKTVSQIIADEKVRQEEVKKKEEEERLRKAEEERKRKEELERIEKEKEAQLNNTIKVTLDSKKVIPENLDKYQFSDIVSFDFTIENTSDKDVRGFQGTSVFKDLFGNEIIKINMKRDEPIKAKSSIKWEGQMELNQFMDEHNELKNTEFKNLQLEYVMATIIFEDGTTINR